MIAIALGGAALAFGPAAVREVRARLGRKSVADRMVEIGGRVGPLWRERLVAAGLSGEPGEVGALAIVVLKAERQVVVVGGLGGGMADGRWSELARYPITAASGGAGPKLREGDNQVPEGVYRVESLNPNSRFRLSLRVDYPSEEDRRVAREEGRDEGGLGGDIMIHGGAASIGCVAIGDPAIEEVFWLVAMVGIERVELLLSPSVAPLELIGAGTPAWLGERYRELDERMVRAGSARVRGPG